MFNSVVTRINVIAEFSPFRLFGLAMIVLLFEQIASHIVEKVIWGKDFVHWGDLIFVLALFTFYVICVNHMAPYIARRWKHDLGWMDPDDIICPIYQASVKAEDS